jgi:hypothetical protein
MRLVDTIRDKMFYRARKLLLQPVLPHELTDTTGLSPEEKRFIADHKDFVRRIKAAFSLEGRQYRSYVLRDI